MRKPTSGNPIETRMSHTTSQSGEFFNTNRLYRDSDAIKSEQVDQKRVHIRSTSSNAGNHNSRQLLLGSMSAIKDHAQLDTSLSLTAMAARTSILDLPVDIILLILPHLEAVDFLHFTASCRDLHTGYLDEPTYWANTTRATFRVANQPVVQKDGARWRKMYKRLKTETRAYGWGDNGHNCLGQRSETEDNTPEGLMRRRRRLQMSWPEEITELNDVGVISDMQGGGWSTSVLTSDGTLRVAGVLDGIPLGQNTSTMRSTLRYPPGFMPPVQRYDPSTAIKQFSHGRQHLLALSDSNRIWSWRDANCAAISVKFVDHDTIEGRRAGPGTVKKVVAGWSKSAAFIDGSGIVVWEPIGRGRNDIEDTDSALVLESAVVPHTNPQLSAENVKGTVENFIVLESLIVFKTDAGKAFVSQITWDRHNQFLPTPIEISTPEDDAVVDVQGTFRHFAIFMKSGAVLTSTQDRLLEMVISNRIEAEPLFDRIKALQHNEVIALAFGDYHFHALHAPGFVTSYGIESESCGSFGLGGYASPEGRLRGIRHEGRQVPGIGAGFRMRGDGKLVPHAYLGGRQVWFEKEKREWIKFLTSGGADPEEAAERVRMAIGTADFHAQGEISEWIEQEGRDWEDKYNARDGTDDGLPAYFVLSITAAGRHSGALVLVNEQLVDRITKAVEVQEQPQRPQQPASTQEQAQPTSLLTLLFWRAYDLGRWFLGINEQQQRNRAHLRRNNPVTFGASPRDGQSYIWAQDHFPRLRLSNGTEMPGTVALSKWRYHEPEWTIED